MPFPNSTASDAEFVRMLLWDDFPECCGAPVVDYGGEYMGQREEVLTCCGCPEPARLSDAQIVAALRERFPEGDARHAAAELVCAAGSLQGKISDELDSAKWPDQRNRGLLQAAKQAEAALKKYMLSNEPRNWNLLYEARSYLRPAIKREEDFRAVLCAAGVPAGAAQSGWIPVSKRLPEPGETVIAFWPSSNGVVHPGCYSLAVMSTPAHWHDPDNDEDDYVVPTHWMPLPAGPDAAMSAASPSSAAEGREINKEK